MTRSRKQQIAKPAGDGESTAGEQSGSSTAGEEQYEFNDNDGESEVVEEKPKKFATRARSTRKTAANKRTHPASDEEADDDEYQQQEEEDDDDDNYEEPKRKSARVTRASNRKRK